MQLFARKLNAGYVNVLFSPYRLVFPCSKPISEYIVLHRKSGGQNSLINMFSKSLHHLDEIMGH